MVCVNCGNSLQQGMKFCNKCGTEIEEENLKQKIFCSSCGKELKLESRFCGGCGRHVKVDIKKIEDKEEYTEKKLNKIPVALNEDIRTSSQDDVFLSKTIELYQIVSELCGYAIAKINKTDVVDEINKLMEPMKEYNLQDYKNNPINMTNWNMYSQKLAEYIFILKTEVNVND